jgi:DNA-binding NarL/FixJ family response regulator
MDQCLADLRAAVNQDGPIRPKIRIVLADDNPGLRAEVQRNLGSEFEVVATVANGRELLEAFDRLRPDVVVTDISMPLVDGFEAAAELCLRGKPPVVFFTVHEDGAFFEEAKALGALGYVLKRSPPSVLARAIRSAYEGHFFLSPELRTEHCDRDE